MTDVQIFLSFDMEHDADLYERLLEQSQKSDSGFEVSGHSETTSDPGEERVRRRIRNAEQVICVCGEHTDESLRTFTELRIAQEENKPYFLLWGRRGTMCKRPGSARATDAMYSWTDAILRTQIAVTKRNAEPREIPDSCKRPVPRVVAAASASTADAVVAPID